MLVNTAAVIGASTLEGFVLVSLFLFPFRRRRSDPASTRAPPLESALPADRRPSVRFAARIVDVAVFLLVVLLAIAVVDPALVDAVGASLFLLLIPIEAALLATWGYTPGKWLLRVSVRDATGRKLPVGVALRRAAAVWTFGIGVNQPVGWLTAALAFRRVRRRGTAYWDELDGHRVDHGSVEGWRAVVAFLVITASLVFIALIGLD